MAYNVTTDLRRRNAVINALKNAQKPPTQKKSDANFFEKTLETIGDFNGQVISGFVKGLEGIYDFGASIVGGVGGLFDKDFQNSVKEHISYDFTGNHITSHFNEWFDDSYLNDGKVGHFVQNVASGIGQMLPSVIVTAATGGAGAGAFITPGLATLGASAMGNATESAFNDGASYYQGMAHGVVSGAVEIATEKLGAKLFGNTAIDDALGIKPTRKTLFKESTTKGGKILQEMASEGLEEGLSEFVSPLTKTIYKGTDALNEYKDREFWGRVGESAAVGAATSLAFGETVGRIHRNTNNANETLAELKTLDMKEENLHASNELFEGNNQQKIDNLRAELRAELSKDVSKMSEKTRAKYIAQNNLGSILNADGSLKTTTINSAQNIKTTSKGDKNGLASGMDNRYYSVGLRGQEQNIVNGLKSQGVKVFKGQLTQVEQDNYNRFKKAHLALSRKGLVRSNFVISEQSSKFDAYLDGNTTVFGKQVFESDEWQKKLIHEIEHFTEGSKEWYEFADFVMNETNLDEANKDILSKKYGITQEDIATLGENLKNNKVTDKQKLYIREVIATQSEFLFGNEKSIERLTASKRSVAQKIYDKIKNFIKVLKAKVPDEKQLIQKLQRAESLFEKALNKAGTDYLIKQSIDTNQNFDYNNETKFARKVVTYIPYDKVGNENIDAIRQSLTNIYGNLDNGVADGIAIENGNTIYVVDSGKENGEIRFGIRNTIKISDETLRKERMVKINDRAIQDGFISEQLSGKIRGSSDKHSRGSIGQQLQKELSVDSRKSENNEGRISKQDADRRREIKYSLSKGQVAKDRANNSKMKVYSKIEADKLINEIVAEKLNIGDKFGTLRGKSKAQAINQMFIALNSVDAGYRIGVAQNIADYIIENAIYEDMYDDGMSEDALYRYNTIKEYRGKLNLSSIKGEIHHKFDTKPGNAIMMQWGTAKDGQGVDTVAQELQERGIQIDAINEADIFFEMLDIYNDARETLNKKAQKIRADYFNSGELKTLKNELVRDILKGYDKYGTEFKFSNLIRKYVDRIALLKETIKDLKNRNKAINGLFATIDKVNGLEKFKSADIELSHEVLGLIKLLKGVKTYRNNLSKNVREIMIKYSQEVDGKKLYDLVANNGDGIENPVAKMVEDIAHGNGELTTNEIRQLDDIMKNFIHNVKEYNRVFFEGKTQNDEAIVKQAIKETQEAVALKNNGFMGSMSKFTRWLTAPVWRFERLSSYRQNGVMTKIFGELQKGVDNQARFNMVVAEHFNKFFKENKKVVSDWNKQTFDLNGAKLSRGQVITLYMLSQRKQAVGHLLSNDGVTGTVRIVNEKHASKGNFKDALAEGVDIQIDYTTLDKIKDSLTDVEKEFIKLSKEFFDKISKDAKYETDMALYGISNVGEENYIPIRVADDQIYKQLGSNEISFSELFSVYNASFNKETKPNAKNKIVVENILDIINRHSKQMASYYGLAVPLKTLNRLYNKKLDDGSKLSIEINKVDPEFERYISKLLGDLQGRGNPRTTFDKVVGKIRSLGAKAALGLNLKVLANQFVSLPASHAVGVEYKNIMKGFAQATAKKTDFDKLTQYCPMLYDRFREGSNIDVGLLKENQGVFGKIDTLTELTTAPIGKIDKFICGAVWNSCLEQTKDSSKYDNYSDEHYKEAAKLTEKAVIKTQANYTALYRPAILREQNSFLQLSTMFMSEPLQQLSLLASSIDKIYVAKKLIKQNNSAKNQALLKQAKAEAKSAITAVMVDAILLTLIAQAFKWVKGQDDEEDIMTSMTNEFASNFIGMFPFIKDLYGLYEGYDVTNMAYTGLTNVYNAFTEMYNIVDLVVSGKQYTDTEIRGKLRKVLLGLSQTFGVPLRNLETYTKGIIEKFAPAFVYRCESLFYNSTMSNYSKELNKAIENDDDALADTIIDVMLADEKVEVEDEKIRTTMRNLFEEGFDVFPKSVGETIIHDGESIKLTKRQYERFRNIYSQANDNVSSLINSKPFEDSPSVAKAKSIKYIYDYYYEEALKDLLGIDSDEKKYLFAQAVDITKLAMIVAQVSQVVADTDKDGKTISGSRKAKIVSVINQSKLTATQKYMLMGYFGYKNANGERQVKTYIQSLKLTKTEKETLFKMCGY